MCINDVKSALRQELLQKGGPVYRLFWKVYKVYKVVLKASEGRQEALWSLFWGAPTAIFFLYPLKVSSAFCHCLFPFNQNEQTDRAVF